jgi:ferrous iron transport protein A
MTALDAVRPGSSVRIRKLDAKPEICTRLREMGFCENSVVRCLQSGASCVCQIEHSRIGLSGKLAGQILVEPLV